MCVYMCALIIFDMNVSAVQVVWCCNVGVGDIWRFTVH